jgi:hypothetical protein
MKAAAQKQDGDRLRLVTSDLVIGLRSFTTFSDNVTSLVCGALLVTWLPPAAAEPRALPSPLQSGRDRWSADR